MNEKLVVILTVFIFLLNSVAYSFDPGCIAGGCEQRDLDQQESSSSLYETDDYQCVCPPKDTFRTALNVFGVLTLPFQFFTGKPYFHAAGSSLEELIKGGCKCKPKPRKSAEQQENMDSYTASEQNSDTSSVTKEGE